MKAFAIGASFGAACTVGALVWRQRSFEQRVNQSMEDFASGTNRELNDWLRRANKVIERAFKDWDRHLGMSRID